MNRLLSTLGEPVLNCTKRYLSRFFKHDYNDVKEDIDYQEIQIVFYFEDGMLKH